MIRKERHNHLRPPSKIDSFEEGDLTSSDSNYKSALNSDARVKKISLLRSSSEN